MNEIIIFSAVMVFGVFLAGCSQILLKIAAKKTYNSRLSEYLNVKVVFAYALFFVSGAVGMYVLRHIPLSLASILTASTYVFVPMLSRLILGEKMNTRQLAGIALIITGVVMFTV